MSLIKFSEMSVGNVYTTSMIAVTISEQMTRNGKPMVRVGLSDGTENIGAIMFDTSKAQVADKGIREGSAVEVKLQIDEYNGAPNYKIQSIIPTELSDSDKTALIRLPPMEPKLLLANIITDIKAATGRPYDMHTGTVPDDDYTLAALAIRLIWNNRKAFYSSSAARSMHHNLYGGLAYHTCRMVQTAISVCNIYKTLDKELLVCGTALHDIGKLIELDTTDTGTASYTAIGSLLGHPLLGIEMIDREVARCDAEAGRETYNREDIMLIKHMIASHHGQLEWEAIKQPAIPEAMILHELDMIDSRMYMYEDALPKVEPGSLSDPLFGISGDGKTAIYRRSSSH